MEMTKELEVFRSAPVPKAALKNTIPAMAAMLMVLIYNLADTLFIGMTHDAYQVAAVSMATPVFLIFMSVCTVFGIGGTSVISRALGEGKLNYAKKACSFCMMYFLRGKSILSIHPRDFTVRNKVCTGILSIGVPASFGSLLMSISQIIMNGQMATFGDMAVAGIGVASKVTMITGMICIGFGQGVQALLGYCVGANLWDRFKKVMTFSVVFSLTLSSIMTGFCYLFTDQIVSVFLTEQAAFDYAAQFVRILLTTSFLFGIFYVLANALQAVGAATAVLIINLSR
jgi:Na+-driven multidrug efflux pump